MFVCCRPVKKSLDVLDRVREEGARVDCAEELESAGMFEVTDL